VHGGPAVGAVADHGRDAGRSGDVDQRRDEPVVAAAVHGGRQPDDRRPDTALGQGESGGFGRDAVAAGRLRIAVVSFGGEATERRDHRARRHDERLAGALERVADRFDCAQVGRSRGGEVPQVVPVGEVDDAIGRGQGFEQPVEVVEGAAVGLGSEGRQRGGGTVGAGEADHLVAGVEQLANDGRSDETGGTGDEDAHGALLS
jgi:hypothetical protein